MSSPNHSASSGLATVNAVLLGVLAIGTCLPFVADDQSPLWSAPPTSDAAATKLAAILLLAVLLWGAATAARAAGEASAHHLVQGVVQVVVAVLAVLAVAFGDELGAGGSLIVVTSVLAAGAGAAVALTSRR